MNTIPELVEAIGACKGAKFVSFVYLTKGTKELARVTVILGASTETLYKKDIATLEAFINSGNASPLEVQAAQAIIDSRKKSLEVGIGNREDYNCRDTFIQPEGMEFIDVNVNDGTVSVTGLVQSKVVLQAGEYKERKSSDFVIAKNKVSKSLELRADKFRRYLLGRVHKARLNGETLELVTDLGE